MFGVMLFKKNEENTYGGQSAVHLDWLGEVKEKFYLLEMKNRFSFDCIALELLEKLTLICMIVHLQDRKGILKHCTKYEWP